MHRSRASHGWDHVREERKREILDAIASGAATRGPVHAELDLTDRCNVACYFCNQQETRTTQQMPLERALALIDELADGGLRSVRLSGGGDPLFHRDIHAILGHLAARGVVVDNLTTNGVGLDERIADTLVAGAAREVIVSLNAVDAADYHRMMKVRPATFEKVLANVRGLVARRDGAPHPRIVVQFLLDRENVGRMVEMYELGAALAPDAIAMSPVLEYFGEKDGLAERRLDESDGLLVTPLIEELVRRDAGRDLLDVHFPFATWNAALDAARGGASVHQTRFVAAPSYEERNGGCFFAWYTTTITGNGTVHPCCLLIRPDREPLGNVQFSSFQEVWNGEALRTMRREMREVLIEDSHVPWQPDRFRILDHQCTEQHACWLKNIHFRGDDGFYRELGERLDRVREETPSFRGDAYARLLARRRMLQRHPRLGPWVVKLFDLSRPTRHLARRLLRRVSRFRETGAADGSSAGASS